jgi:hypothetical protein
MIMWFFEGGTSEKEQSHSSPPSTSHMTILICPVTLFFSFLLPLPPTDGPPSKPPNRQQAATWRKGDGRDWLKRRWRYVFFFFFLLMILTTLLGTQRQWRGYITTRSGWINAEQGTGHHVRKENMQIMWVSYKLPWQPYDFWSKLPYNCRYALSATYSRTPFWTYTAVSDTKSWPPRVNTHWTSTPKSDHDRHKSKRVHHHHHWWRS